MPEEAETCFRFRALAMSGFLLWLVLRSHFHHRSHPLPLIKTIPAWGTSASFVPWTTLACRLQRVATLDVKPPGSLSRIEWADPWVALNYTGVGHAILVIRAGRGKGR